MPRPQTIEEFHAAMAKLASPEGRGRGLAFKPRVTDVIISPYGKSGTTMLQQMVHTLRTGGDVAHEDISAVVPWLETSTDVGIDIDAEQRANPRAFKSHLSYDLVPKGCRYIVSLRDPKDALVSAYRFMEGWYFEPGSISMDEFAQDGYLSRPLERSYWGHFLSWWNQRDNPSVLLLAYENILSEKTETIRRVADFIGVPMDEQLLAITEEHTSLEFMLRHKHLFDDKLMRDRSEQVAGLPPNSDSAKVRKGRVGEHQHELSAAIGDAMDAIWRERVTAAVGLATYADASAALSLNNSVQMPKP